MKHYDNIRTQSQSFFVTRLLVSAVAKILFVLDYVSDSQFLCHINRRVIACIVHKHNFVNYSEWNFPVCLFQ
ncbi:MAG: hypothetical protein K0A98_09835, partial [Trueperaceae bacterium]|nr:hypothetical protein [Trueperaceae bacterium]